MILFVNASPRIKKSSTECFISRLKNSNDEVYLYEVDFNSIDFSKYDTLVFAYPLYVDNIPSKLLELFEYIEKNNIDIKNKNIYALPNCGFLEPIQNFISIEVIKNFAKKNSAIFKGYLSIGSGVILGLENYKIRNKLLSIDYYFKIRKFKKYIYNSKNIYITTMIHPITKHIYMRCANNSFTKQQKTIIK